MFKVRLDCVVRDEEPIRDLTVGESFRDQAHGRPLGRSEARPAHAGPVAFTRLVALACGGSPSVRDLGDETEDLVDDGCPVADPWQMISPRQCHIPTVREHRYDVSRVGFRDEVPCPVQHKRWRSDLGQPVAHVHQGSRLEQLSGHARTCRPALKCRRQATYLGVGDAWCVDVHDVTFAPVLQHVL